MPILVEWLVATITLVGGRKRNATLMFMDGPFYAAVFAKRRDTWVVQFVERGWTDEKILYEGNCDPDAFLSSLLAVSESVVQECVGRIGSQST
jgi:hypothetical protein